MPRSVFSIPPTGSAPSGKTPSRPSPQPAASAAKLRLRFNPAMISRLRERLGLSLRKTAQLVGVTPRAVMLWERGIFVPRMHHQITLKGLARLTKREAHDQLASAT